LSAFLQWLVSLLAACFPALGDGDPAREPSAERVPGRARVLTPRAYEVWDGKVRGVARPGARSVLVRVGDRRVRVRVGVDRRYAVRVAPVPRGPGRVVVDGGAIDPVWGVPAGSLRALRAPANRRGLAAAVAALARATTPVAAVYVHAADGTAAAWNAGAPFEAASTLKLPLMLAALARTRGPLADGPLWAPFARIAAWSDNAAANEVLIALGGSEAGGAAEMVGFLRSLGIRTSAMSGGYLAGAGGGPPPVRLVESPPGSYKQTTAADMASLARWLAAAAVGRGPLPKRGVTRGEARQLLYLLLGARTPGLVPAGAGGLPVAHKIGWLEHVRHDVAIVFAPAGPVVVVVLTAGVIDGTVEELGRAVTRAALRAVRAAPSTA
jgi:beta-lactamase class A